MAAKKVTGKTGMSLDDQIRKMYGTTKKSLVSSRGSAEPYKTGGGPVSRREYVSSFQDVVAESSLGMGKRVMDAAARVATEQWNNTFGPKKAAAKAPAKPSTKAPAKPNPKMTAKSIVPGSYKAVSKKK